MCVYMCVCVCVYVRACVCVCVCVCACDKLLTPVLLHLCFAVQLHLLFTISITINCKCVSIIPQLNPSTNTFENVSCLCLCVYVPLCE